MHNRHLQIKYMHLIIGNTYTISGYICRILLFFITIYLASSCNTIYIYHVLIYPCLFFAFCFFFFRRGQGSLLEQTPVKVGLDLRYLKQPLGDLNSLVKYPAHVTFLSMHENIKRKREWSFWFFFLDGKREAWSLLFFLASHFHAH